MFERYLIKQVGRRYTILKRVALFFYRPDEKFKHLLFSTVSNAVKHLVNKGVNNIDINY